MTREEIIKKLTETNSAIDKHFDVEFIILDYCDGLTTQELKDKLNTKPQTRSVK